MAGLPTQEGHGRHTPPLTSADEWDAFSRRARNTIVRFDQPGVTKNIKRTYNKRARAREKRELKRSSDE